MKCQGLLLYALSFITVVFHTRTQEEKASCIYQLQIAPQVPFPAVIHKGVLLKPQEGSIFFKDIKKNSLTMVVTTVQTPTSNTIASLQIPSGQPYTLYTCQKTLCKKTKETSYYRWDIKEEKALGSACIPQDAVVILLHPDAIKTISTPTWAKESVVIPLPQLTLTENGKKECISSSMASIDMRAFHAKISDTMECQGKTRSTQRRTT